ncbi:MAG: 2-hydroxy-6-oxohepta-2,4-dienoate hydrolase [Deltaproteobacteria bacterium HGW-Deltaproteobacteria-14]|jgi:pimeloyl-ACP methyl ester carboxylesterase|nr:MAG: 2-hydroxy-6-oxohepta-2,4-dienoate hydrolase [Deltaproteobacteria bacterium HGW-Deltaproteobacteria-14]
MSQLQLDLSSDTAAHTAPVAAGPTMAQRPGGRVGPPTDRLMILAARALGRARSRWAETSHGRVHALEVEGTGQGAAVLIHGFSSTGAHLLPLMRHLRGGFARLIAPDLPGHGLTPTLPDDGDGPSRAGVAALAEALASWVDAPAVVFGSSLGGLAAVRYALAEPARVRALVLSSPAGAPMDEADLAAFQEGFRVRTHGDALGFVDRVMDTHALARHVLAWGVRRRFARPALRAIIEGARSEDLLTRGELLRLSMPVLCLWGERDRVLAPAARDFYRSALPPHARFERLAALGHGPYLERPDVVARRIRAFTDALAARGGRA